jgi:hypothetical protein
LQALGFKLSIADASLFVFQQNGVSIYMLIYVDDIIIVSSSNSATDKLIQNLSEVFVVKDLGSLQYFLGIEVNQSEGGIVLSQKRYDLICSREQIWRNARQFQHPCLQLTNY